MLDALDDAAPGMLTLEELSARVPDSGEDYLRRLAWAAACAGVVQLHVRVPRLATTPGERPIASAVAQAQLEHGETVTNLRHDAVKLDDEMVRQLLPLLDGTRDLAALVATLGQPPDAIAGRLRHLAKLALLVA